MSPTRRLLALVEGNFFVLRYRARPLPEIPPLNDIRIVIGNTLFHDLTELVERNTALEPCYTLLFVGAVGSL